MGSDNRRIHGKAYAGAAATVLALAVNSHGVAGDLDLADNALEVVTGVAPNIMVLSDDSGSMDWGLMTPEDEGKIWLDGLDYFYTHPDTGVTTTDAPAANTSYFIVPTQEELAAQGVAAPQGGVWRAWNPNYNAIYYNPTLTYRPWAGVDKAGNAYTDVLPTKAPYNPYDSTLGGLDLTAVTTYDTDCGLADCSTAGVTAVTVTSFYPARFYVWTDSDGDDVVDADDVHKLVEIRSSGCSTGASCPTSFTHPAFDRSTGAGRRDCSTNNGDGTVTCTVAEELQNFANWFSYYRKRDLTAKTALGLVIARNATARIGYATINDNASNGIKVAQMNISATSGNKKSLLDKVYQTRPDSTTPLRTKLEEVGKYFECASNGIFGSPASAPGDPDCPVLAAPAGTCQQNYALLMSDGFYNGGEPANQNKDGDGNTDFDGGAFADGFKATLADVAMNFYERNLHGTLANDVPTTPRDLNRYPGTGTLGDTMHQHMATYTLGFGVDSTLKAMPPDPTVLFDLDGDTVSDWPDPTLSENAKIDDMRHAAYNGRGDFLSARNPLALAGALSDIFEAIGAGEGAASSVAFNTQTIESNSLVFRAFFNTLTDTGDLVAQKIKPDGTLNVDGAGNPIYEWSAASRLDTQTGISSDSRVIITYDPTASQGVPFRWTGTSAITTAQQALLDKPQPANITLPDTVGEERLDYLRGRTKDEGPSFDNGEFRERPLLRGKLGDIVHSSPVFVGKPPFTGRFSGAWPGEFPTAVDDFYSKYASDNKNRAGVIYVGANDGMLHAFKAATGNELFAYVPNMVFENLSESTDPNYDHRYYVDLSPSINDVFMKKKGASVLSWNTVLVGGLGAGGKGYYALNISDPNDFTTEAGAANNVMWEFTEADDGTVGNSDLGYSFSLPLLAMSNAEYGGGEKKWVAIFGNGYNSTSTDGDAALYILFLEAGQDGTWDPGDFVKITTGYGKAESADGTTPNGIGGVRGIDLDGNGTVDYVYAGDLQGNLYRFDLSNTTPSNWDSSSVSILFRARYGTGFPRTTVQPITTRPIVVKHPDQGGFIVVTATGSWMTNDDASNTDIQSIYGIWDDLSNTPEVTMTTAGNELVEQVFTNKASKEHSFTVRTLTNNTIAWKNTGTSKVKGWYVDLDMPAAGTTVGVEYPGERAVRNLQVRGGLLFVNTVIPRSSNVCSTGAGGFELGFNPVTGGSGSEVVFDLDGDGVFDLNDNVNDTAGDANIVTGIRFDDSTPADSAFIGKYRLTQTSDKKVRGIGTNTENGLATGRQSWREIGS